MQAALGQGTQLGQPAVCMAVSWESHGYIFFFSGSQKERHNRPETEQLDEPREEKIQLPG